MARKRTGLDDAKRAKKDEFYTTREDIEAELCNYEQHFRDKVVYCNCDDPVTSEFWQFFRRNFKVYGLKRLIATHYETDAQNFSYSLDLSEDTNGDGVVDWNDEPVITKLPCNGDFRSAACIELLKQADIVVTNPPFSLFREYIAQLVEYDKKFIILGNLNAVKYEEVFPLFMQNKVWLGQSIHSGDRKFWVPDDYPLNASMCGEDKETGRHYIRVKGVRWFTNLDIPKRHEILDLRGNYYSEEKFQKYVNYDAIEVSKTEDIPCDYDGPMGVPISFIDKYNPDQFELIGVSRELVRTLSEDVKKHGDYPQIGVFYMDRGDGTYKKMYDRFVIRNKHPEQRSD